MSLARNIRRLFRKRDKAAAKRKRAYLEPLEPRILLSDMSYSAAPGEALDATLRLQSVENVDTLQLVDNSTQSVLASQALAEFGAGDWVSVSGSDQADKLTVDFSSPFSIPVSFNDASGSDQDTLKITGGDDRLWQIMGADTGTAGTVMFSRIENLVGGEADDTFLFAGGTVSGTLDGAGGSDALDYSGYSIGVTVDLSAGTATSTGSVLNIENIVGGSGNDRLTGNEFDNILTGGLGADWLTGGGGIDTVVETRNANFTLTNTGLKIGSESDILSGIEAARLTGGAGNNILDASAFTLGSVTLDGGGGNDLLKGGTGDDVLIGGTGSSTLRGGAGNDRYVLTPGYTYTITENAGAGNDTLDYSAYTASDPVTVDLAAGSATGVSGSVVNFENVIGGAGNDTLSGNAQANRLAGGLGNNILTGGAGDDTYILTQGATNTITDSAGNDTLDYSEYTDSVTVDLGTGSATGVSESVAGVIENVIGGAGNDSLTGDANANRLSGGPGNDTLSGGAGDDTYVLTAGGGEDTIVEVAGGGSDTILGRDADTEWYISGPDSGTVAGSSFVFIEHLIGGSGDDYFVFESGGSISGDIQGGAQNVGDTFVAPDVANIWTITGSNTGTLNGNVFSGIENLVGGEQDDTFSFLAGGSISGLISGGPQASNGVPAVDTLDYSLLDTSVEVNLASRTATGAVSFAAIDQIKGGSGSDTLFGPGEAVVEWTIDGADAGSVSGVRFEGFENLTGADTSSDAFTFEAAGSLSGTLEGGFGTMDAIRVFKTGGGYTVFNPSSGTDQFGVLNLNGKTINYAGMDHQDLSGGDVYNLVFSGTMFGEKIIIEDIADTPEQAGLMQVRFEGLEVFDGTTTASNLTYTFVAPVDSLKIEAKEGADTIEVKSLDSTFSAKLLLYGNKEGAPPLIPDLATDSVVFSGNTFTHGGDIEVFAESITVNENVAVSTLADPADLDSIGGDITFRARRINTTDLTNLSPLMVNLRDVEVNIGKEAELRGGEIYLFAQAEDRSLTTLLGTDRLVNNFIIQPLLDKVADLAAMPVKVLYKQSEATITIGEGAQIVGSGTVGLYAAAASDASGKASSKYFSVGYAQATATANVDIQAGALIQSTSAAVVVTSDANATAKMETGTEQEQGDSGIAGSLAISNAKSTSTVTLAATATVEAAKTANLRAKGDIKSETEAKGSTFADGTAGMGFGISFSDSDIHTQVDGTVIAHVAPNYLVKLEFDPLETDPNKPGYIDYEKNMINVGGTGLVTEDVVNYDSRRGTQIGGLIDDQDYVIISVEDDPSTPDIDESQYVQLALTEQNAIEGKAVDLWYSTLPGLQVTDNTKEFDGHDIDSNLSRITLDNSAWSTSDNGVDWQLLGLTFELGQAVVYHQGSAPIEGLVDGQTYYVITGINEFDLQGDNRFIQKQVIQLAETEMEARAGVNVSFSIAPENEGATGFRLEAKHLLDSGFSNGIGILAELKAEDKASAEAGVEDKEDGGEEKKSDDSQQQFKLDGTIFDTMVGSLLENGSGENTAQAGAGSAGVDGSAVKAAGAFAFSYADHSASTDVGATAVLKSNEDLEIKAIITHEVQLSAEASVGAPKKDASAGEASSGSGDSGSSGSTSAGSVAVDVGLFTTNAQATVHGGAELDALRATRVISLVQHPYLKSPDEFIPSTLGEFISSIESEGYEALEKYLNLTKKAKEDLFNSWARASAESDQVSIAGMVNILSFNNTAESLVETGALINQDEAWRTYASNPHENNEDPALGENDETSGEQVVSVEASNYMELMNMTGYFDINLPGSGESVVDAAASKGGKGGVGGALFVMLMDNKTHSTIEDGAKIYSGMDGTFNMKADEAIFNVNLGQAGASAGKVSVAGTVMYTDQDSDTVARLGAGAEVTGREVSIYAASLETNAMWAGGVVKGHALGAGISVAVNDINRTTLALIGEQANQSVGVRDDVPGIHVAEDVTARAIVGGEIWAFTVAGAVVTEEKDNAKENGPGNPSGSGDSSTDTDADPLDGVSLPRLFDEAPNATGSSGSAPSDTTQKQQTGVAIAAAAGVNLIHEYTQASVIDAGQVDAGSLSLTSENQTRIVALTGGLAFTKESSGNNAISLAGAFSYNAVDATTRSLVEDTDFTLDGQGIEWDIYDRSQRNPAVRISSLADAMIVAGAAGGAGSVASGQGGAGGGSGSGSTAVAVAGSVSVNAITSENTAAARNSNFTISSGIAADDESNGDFRITASDKSRIFAIGGGLSLSIATGKQGSSTAVSAGIAVSVNEIDTSTTAMLEDGTVTWESNSRGDFLVHAKSSETIDAYTLAGAVSVASGTSGTGVAASGAASGSVNFIDFNTQALVKDSTVMLGTGGATVLAEDKSEISSGAGGIAAAVGLSSQGNGGAGAFGAAFSINSIGSAGEGSFILADVENSEISSGDNIVIEALNDAEIFALGIGAAGSVTSSGSGNAIAGSLAGSASINQIRSNTQARARKGSRLVTRDGSGGAIDVLADDASSINATAGAASLSIAVAQNTAVAAGLGLSLTINDITNTTRAVVEDSDISACIGGVDVSAASDADIDSLAFGISVGVAVSGNASAISANATGALSFNEIDNIVEATVGNLLPTGTETLSSGGPIMVTASDDSTIDAIATAGAASISGSTSATSVSVGIGLALAHNTIDKDVSASLVNLPSVLSEGHDVKVGATDASEINATTFAAAVSVAVGNGTGVGIAGGAAESTNVILSRTNAFIENSAVGDETHLVGNVDVTASGSATINAAVGSVAAAVAVGNTAGVGVAVGISVARNFIGWDPNGVDVTPKYESTHLNGEGMAVGTQVAGLNPGDTVLISSGALAGDIYEYIGPAQTADDPNTTEVESLDLSVQQYRDATLWRHVNVGANNAQVQAYLDHSSVWAAGELTIEAEAIESIDAVVVAAAVGVGAGNNAGVAVSGAGSYSENKIKTDVEAYIEGDGVNGATVIHAGGVTVKAEDASGINAIAGAASIAAGFGSTAGVGVALGLSLGFNEVSNNIEAFVSNAEVSATVGSITISALNRGQHLFDLDVGGRLTPENLDDAAQADSDNPDDPMNDHDDVTSRFDDSVNEAVVDADEDRLVLEDLRSAFAARGENLPQYDIVGTASKFDTGDGTQDVREGDTVRVEKGYGHEGLEGRVYRYIVMADEDSDTPHPIDLGSQDYTNTSRWQLVEETKLSTLVEGKSWALMAADGKSYVLELSEDGTGIHVSRNTINAVSAAASLGVGVGGTAGVAVSGAGAVAQNVILTQTNAFGLESVLDSNEDVTVSAASTSTISAAVVAASLAIGGGGTVGVGASIGIAVAQNFIGWTPDGTETPAQVRAFLSNTAVIADGDLTLRSLADQSIDSVVFSGSVAIAPGGTVGVAVAGSGVWAENKIGVDVKSFIDGDRDSGTVGIAADSVTITADDSSTIKAVAGAASIAASVGGTVGVSVSIGVSLARNIITSDVGAYIVNADGLPSDVTDFGICALGPDGVAIQATERASISAVSAAASIGAGFGGVVGVSVSGAGADASNIILTGTNAYVQDSAISSAGKLDLDADSAGRIEAAVVSASASIAVGGITGVGASLGVAVARNYIGWDPNYGYDADYVTGESPDEIVTGDTVKIGSGVNAGNVYEYIGAETLQKPTATGGGAGEGNEDENNNWLTRLDYNDRSQWRLVNLEKNAAAVQAYIIDSNVDAAGALTLDAISSQTIDATVFAGSVAISGGLVGVSVSGAGAGAENRIATLVQAYMQGEKDGQGIRAESIGLNAEDSSVIDSFTGAVSIAGSGGLVGVSLSIGVGVAFNEIESDVAGFIRNIGAGVTSTTGDISIAASEDADIDATAAAASAAVALGGVGVSLSGAGAAAVNTILGTTGAFVENSVLTSGRDVVFDANNTSAIEAEIITASAAVAGGAAFGAGLSIGAAVAENSIGYTSGGDSSPVEVTAYVQNSSIDAGRDLKLTATSAQEIEAVVGSGSVAASAGGFGGIGLSGAGAGAVNRVAASVHAFIDETDPDTGEVGAMNVIADSISLTAEDSSTIDATVGTASVGFGVGLVGAAISVGVSVATNEVSNQVSAYIANAGSDGPGVETRSGGDISISATESATIEALGVAASAALGAGTVGVGLAGAGVEVTNVILNKTSAYIQNAVVGTNGQTDGNVIDQGGDVVLAAADSSTIKAKVGTLSGALGAGAVGGAVAIGVAVAQNLIGWTPDGTADPAEVRAYVKDSSIEALGELSLTAQTDSTIEATVASGSVALAGGIVGIGGAGAGASTHNRIGTLVEAFIDGDTPASSSVGGISAGSISLLADDRSTITALTESASLAGAIGAVSGTVAIGVGVAKNDVANDVKAYIFDTDVVATGSNGISVKAKDEATITATATAASAAVSGGLVGVSLSGAGADAVNIIGTATRAYIENSDPESAGNIDVKSEDTSTINAYVRTTAAALSGGEYSGAVAIGAATARNLIGWGTDASASFTYTTADDPASIANGDKVKVVNGADAGSVYKFIGTEPLEKPAEASEDCLERIDYSDRTQWELVNLVKNAAEVHAYLKNSSPVADGFVNVAAQESATITANIDSESLSGSIGLIAVGLSGAGVSIENSVNTSVEAYIKAGESGETFVQAGTGVTVTATDTSVVTSTAKAVSYAFAIGAGAAGAISLSSADNHIENSVKAYATSARISTVSGNLAIAATEDAEITSESTAASWAASGLFSVASSGASADATIATVTRAYADPVELDIAGNLTIDAISTALGTAESSSDTHSAGFISISGAETKATVNVKPITEARLAGYTGEGETRLVQAGGAISVIATQAAAADATASGDSYAIGFGADVGATTATAVIGPAEDNTPNVKSTISSGHIVSNGGITVKSVYNTDRDGKVVNGSGATASATAASGGLVASSSADAYATSEADVQALVASSAVLDATGASIDVSASGKNAAEAIVEASGGGAVHLQFILSEAIVKGSVSANLDGDVVGASSVTVGADGRNNANAEVSASGGGVISVQKVGAVASVGVNPWVQPEEDDYEADVTARVGSQADIHTDALYVTASADNDARAYSEAATGGLAAAADTKPAALMGGTIHSLIDGYVTGATQIEIEAESASNARAITSLTSAGLIGIGEAAPEASVTDKALTQAQIGSGAEIASPLATLLLRSVAENEAFASAETEVGGGVSVSRSNPIAESYGRSEASLLGNVRVVNGTENTPGADTITVLGQGIDATIAQIRSVTGGGISVGNATTDANTESSTTVTIGGSGSVIVATGDISVKALGMSDADSSTKSTGGGGVNINNYEAWASTSPTVTTTVASGTFLKTDGLVTITAAHNVREDNDLSFYVGPENPLFGGVSGEANTIVFAKPHGLATGEVVKYDLHAGFGVQGLESGRIYNVIADDADPNAIQLGSAFDGASVDTLTDQIVFSNPHNLKDGDKVYYFGPTGGTDVGGLTSGTLYRVHKIDDYHIKLLLPGQNTPSVGAAGTEIDEDSVNVANHFEEGAAVTYHAPTAGGSFTSMLVDAKVNGLDLVTNQGGVVTEDNDAIIADWNGDQTLDAHNLTTGTEVIYTCSDPSKAIGGLTSGNTYYVIDYSQGQIRLAESYDQAVGRRWEDPDGDGTFEWVQKNEYVEHIALTPDQSASGSLATHTLSLPQNAPIPGLVDGQTYYVVNRTDTSFQLADELGGSPISLNTGSLSGGPHKFAVEGIDLQSAGTGEQKLVLDIEPGPPSFPPTIATLERVENLVGAPSGDLVVTAAAAGGGGGFIDVEGGYANASSSPTVSLVVKNGAVIDAGQIEITTNGVGTANGTATNNGAGFVSVGDAKAIASVYVTSTITVEQGAALTAAGDILIQSKSDLDGDSKAETDSAGLVGCVDSRARTDLDYKTGTTVDGTITAGNALTIEARTLVDGYVYTYADASGLGADADANDDYDYGVRIGLTKGYTFVDIQDDAVLSAETVELNALVDKFKGQASAEAYAEAAGTDCDSGASVKAAGSNEVILETGADITGKGSVLIRSQYLNIDFSAVPYSDSDSVGGDTDSSANIDVNTSAKVTGRDEAIIRTADLDVDTKQEVDRYERSPSHDGAWIDTGSDNCDGSNNLRRDIFWESRVIMLGEDSSPEVEIDSTGTVTKIVGDVTLTDQHGNPYGVGDTFDADDDIVVGDLVNHDGGGTAEFRANDLTDLGAPESVIWGNNADFEMQNGWDHVFITNRSDRDLVTNLINGVSGSGGTINVKVDRIYGPTDTPPDNISLYEDSPDVVPVELFGTWVPLPGPAPFEFDINPHFASTMVRIENLQPGAIADSNIFVDGNIENPIGTTQILNERGDILAGPDSGFELIRTNRLSLAADTGTIGKQAGPNAGRAPISVELVRFADEEGAISDMALTADAAKDVVLDLTANDRSQATAATFIDVNIARIKAGDDVDLVINDSKSGDDSGNVGGVQVNLYNPPSEQLIEGRWQSGRYAAHFRPDRATDAQRAFGLQTTDIDSTYHFDAVRAGGDIDIGHISTTADYGDERSYDLTQITLTDTNQDGILEVGVAHESAPDKLVNFVINTDVDWTGGNAADQTPQIFLTTNGDITATEMAGDMLVGHIHSTAGDVTLSSPERILDADGKPTADVTGEDIIMTAGTGLLQGGIGLANDFLEINVNRNNNGGVLIAHDIAAASTDGIFLDELQDNMRIDLVETSHDVSLRTENGSIVEGLRDSEPNDDMDADVLGQTIDIHANGGSIGTNANDLEIDSLRGSADVGLGEDGDDVALEASTGIRLTETDGKLRLLLAHSDSGDIRLTVRDSADTDEGLELIKSGTALFAEGVNDPDHWRIVDHGRIFAEDGSVLLRAGDDVTTHQNSEIVATQDIDIYGDYGNADEAIGANILLRGRIVAGAVVMDDQGHYSTLEPSTSHLIQVWGNTDADNIWFGSKDGAPGGANWGDPGFIFLGATTLVYGAAGNDFIEARPVNIGVTIFGGDGNDIIWGSQQGDHLDGGSGDDEIHGQGGNDHIYGDSGFDIDDVVSPTLNRDEALGDLLQAGKDKLYGEGGDDIIFGDHGSILQSRPKLLSTNYVYQISSDRLEYGNDDIIEGSSGADILLGGGGNDTIYGDVALPSSNSSDGEDIIFGDNGQVLLRVGEAGRLNYTNSGVRIIETLDDTEATGGNDTIEGDAKGDVLFGGVGSDHIHGDRHAGSSGTTIPKVPATGLDGNDLILGDNGKVDFGSDIQDLDKVTSQLFSTTGVPLGGNDTITGDRGSDTIIGGNGSDTIYGDNAAASAGTNDGEDVLIGDNAEILYAGDAYPGCATPGRLYTLNNTPILSIHTTDPGETSGGGADYIEGNAKGDIIIGGPGSDTIHGDRAVQKGMDGNDLILGDNGLVDFGTDPMDLDLVRTDGDYVGANDTITGDRGADTIIGGVGSDVIYGDNATAAAGAYDGADVLIGDFAQIKYAGAGYDGVLTPVFYTLNNSPITQIKTNVGDWLTAGQDTITGNAKADLLMGGENIDTLNSDGSDYGVFQDENSISFVAAPMTAMGPAPVTASNETLSTAELAPIVDEAKTVWAGALGNDGKASSLGGVQVSVADLPGDTLGMAIGNTIVIDANAAGYGWFIDSTPAESSEFTGGSSVSGMDLLTVVMHEMGHLLGYSHGSMEVMNSELASGTRYAAPAVAEPSSLDSDLSGLSSMSSYSVSPAPFDMAESLAAISNMETTGSPQHHRGGDDGQSGDSGIVSFGAEWGGERLNDIEIESRQSWLVDFLVNGGKDKNDPNAGIVLVI